MWNKHLEEVSGYDRDEMREIRPLDFFAREEKARVADRIHDVFEHGHAEVEAEFLTKSGNRIPYYFNGTLLHIDGEPHLMGMGLDISRRHRAEQRLDTVLRAGRMGTWVWDLETHTSVFNQQEFELLGLEASTGPVSSDVFFQRVHDEDRKELERRVGQAISGSGHFEHEFRVVRADGEVRWIAGRGQVIPSASLGARQMFGVNYDITDLKRHEEEMETANYLLEMVLNNIPQGVFWKDRNSIYLGCNPLVGEMAGFRDPSEMIGKNDLELPTVTREQAESFISVDREVMATGEPQIGIVDASRHPDGRLIWLETNKVPLRDSRGEIVGVLGTWTDITGKRKLEEQLRQSQKMEAFGQLAAGVAHDFNNLLTVITGYSDILMMNLEEDDPRRSAVVSIGNAAERAAALTRQLVAFSRLTVLDPRITNLNRIVEEMDGILRRLIGGNITFTTSLDGELWPVKVDQSQIGQVLLNLVINARDAMPAGGTLTIETRNIVLDEAMAATMEVATPGKFSMLAVSDTGIGIPEDELVRVFEPFFTTKGPGKGTGLGLAVVHGIVKQSGGSIEVVSEPGAGSTFRICLPAVEEDQEAAKNKKRDPGSFAGTETILLVEDEAAVRSYAKHALLEHGYKVIESADGHEAIELAGKNEGKIDLLLTDVVMPGIDGHHLADQLTALHPHLKVLFISGHTDDSWVKEEILNDRAGFLQKPFSLTALASKVREVLDGSRQK